GRENREAGEKPARDRRRKGESGVQHATAGTRGKADAGRGTQAGRPALGSIAVSGWDRTRLPDGPNGSTRPTRRPVKRDRLCCPAPLQYVTGAAFLLWRGPEQAGG